MRSGVELERRHPVAFNVVGGSILAIFGALLFRNPWFLIVAPAIWIPGRLAMARRRTAR
jgi:hypothetical protein